MDGSLEIHCPGCQKESLLVREPVYDGFTRTGDTLKCMTCGHTFDDEESVPYVHRGDAGVFTDEDRPERVEVFSEGEAGQLCRYCAMYVVNPFLQWCSYHKREVQATDSCDQFVAKDEDDGDALPL